MPDFYYEGISREGEKIRGQIFADDEVDLRVKLRTQKIRPVKIKISPYTRTPELVQKKSHKNEALSDTEMVFFIKELLVMFKTGLTIIQALEVLSSEGKNQKIVNMASSIKANMQSGMTFSQALSRFPKYFDNLFLNVVASGELRGNLEEVLSEWLDYFKRDNEVKKTVLRSVMYPTAISFIILASLLILAVGIAPVFVHIYRTYEVTMPGTLLTISALGDIIKVNFFPLLTVLITLIVLLLFASRLSMSKVWLENFLIRAPGISRFFREVYTLRTILAINVSLRAGLSMQRAMELASEKISNHDFESCLLKAREAAEKSEPIAPFLARSGLIRPMIVQVFSIGELMGALPEMLGETIEYLSDELKKLSHLFSSVMEPLILILGGVLIGALLTSFFIPLFTVLSRMQ